MTRIYDPQADQLKCNFCTQWFNCSFQFAKIQRYSLNGCRKCIDNFRYSVVDPQTYKIFRVLLLDTGLTMPRPQIITNQTPNITINGIGQGNGLTSLMQFQLLQTQQDIKSKCSDGAHAKINKITQELSKFKSKIQAQCQKIKRQYFSQQQQTEQIHVDQEMFMNKLKQLKEKAYQQWINESNQKKQYQNNRIQELTAVRRKDSFQSQNKQNINPNTSSNRINCARLIKSKIIGLAPPQPAIFRNSHSKDSKSISRSQSKSIIKSVKIINSIRKLDESSYSASSHWHQNQRTEIFRLLDQKHHFQSYLPEHVTKDQTELIKKESNRNIVDLILQTKEKTAKGKDLIQLIGGDAKRINFDCYLKSLGNVGDVKTVRIIKSNLVDADFDHLLKFIGNHPSVQALIVTNNRLSELSIIALENFKLRHPDSKLSQAYFGNNFIKSYKALPSCRELGRQGLEIYI